jgi:hypothetical protein
VFKTFVHQKEEVTFQNMQILERIKRQSGVPSAPKIKTVFGEGQQKFAQLSHKKFDHGSRRTRNQD